jgi:hypothetical protein
MGSPFYPALAWPFLLSAAVMFASESDEKTHEAQNAAKGRKLFFLCKKSLYIYIQGVTGGMCQTSGGCSLC